MPATFALLLALSPAQAAGSDTDSFDLTTEVAAWPATDLDSGWWPESGPVRIRTVLNAEGRAYVDMPGQSIVEETAQGAVHRVVPSGSDSEAGIALSIAAALHLSVDVAGYSWEDVLHEQDVDFDVSESFADFAFADDGGTEMTLPMDSVEIFEIDQGIFPMVDVVVTGTLSPTAAVAINTDTIDTNWGTFTSAEQRVATTGGTTPLGATGTLDSVLSLIVQGHAEVCIMWVDCYGNFNYDFEMDPIEHTQALTYDAGNLNHSKRGAAAGDEAGGSAQAGGCSTAPTAAESGAWMVVLALIGLVSRRRS